MLPAPFSLNKQESPPSVSSSDSMTTLHSCPHINIYLFLTIKCFSIYICNNEHSVFKSKCYPTNFKKFEMAITAQLMIVWTNFNSVWLIVPDILLMPIKFRYICIYGHYRKHMERKRSKAIKSYQLIR